VSALRTDCPRCGRVMVLEIPAGADAVDIERIARLVLCDQCSGANEPKPAKAKTEGQWLPYRDD
jgi:hypothetical protein